MFIGIGEQLIMIYLHDEGYFRGILPRHYAQHPQRGSDGVAAAFYGQPDDVFRVEVDGVRGKGGASAMLNALVYRQYGKVTGMCEPPVVK